MWTTHSQKNTHVENGISCPRLTLGWVWASELQGGGLLFAICYELLVISSFANIQSMVLYQERVFHWLSLLQASPPG